MFPPNSKVIVEDSKILFSKDTDYAVYESELCVSICSLVDGIRSAENIVNTLSNKFDPADVYFALFQMVNEGILLQENSQKQILLSFLTGDDRFNFSLQVSDINIVIESGFSNYLPNLKENLSRYQIKVDPGASKVVLITSDMLSSWINDTLDANLFSEREVVVIQLGNKSMWIGPVLKNNESCWDCLRSRIRSNIPAEYYLSTNEFSSPNRMNYPDTIWSYIFQKLLIEIAKWGYGTWDEKRRNQLVSFDWATGESSYHTFSSRPNCSNCGENKVADKSVVLLSRIVQKVNNYRLYSPGFTYERYEHLISKITGIVNSVRQVKSEGLLFNYTVAHSLKKRHQSIESLRLATRDHSGGKGINDMQAKTSGLCEALERYSAIYEKGLFELTHTSFQDVKEKGIHPNNLMLYSEDQYKQRAEWNAKQTGAFQLVSEPLDETQIMEWVEVQSLSGGPNKIVPAGYCFYDYAGPGYECFKADSNGLAAGNCIEEAILQAILELIERDAVAQWWYNRIQMPELDLDSLSDPYIHAMRDFYNENDRDLWVIDVTNDIEVPVFVAISRKRDAPQEDILLGFGAHIDTHLAVTRAILEINQSFPISNRSNEERDKQLLPEFADVVNWWNEATVECQPYLKPDYNKPKLRVCLDKKSYKIDLKFEIEKIVNRLKRLDLDTYVLDLTRPDIGLSVVRILIPGLRHFWRRLAPGRLYSVPVKNGLIHKELTEEELNPISLFL